VLKALVLKVLRPDNQYRPRWIVRVFINPFVHKRGWGSVINRYARLDVMPFHIFNLGAGSVIEDFACINNQVGDVVIGNRTLVGLSDVVIGPVVIGDDVLLAQHVVISALNHNYQDVTKPIRLQGYTTAQIVIQNGVWIGANSVVAPGVTIGQNSVIGAGSVVTKDVPPFSVALGNPARVLKTFSADQAQWVKQEHFTS
jgi:acetyltransferase-like isoleucine patch superfamily enzyme